MQVTQVVALVLQVAHGAVQGKQEPAERKYPFVQVKQLVTFVAHVAHGAVQAEQPPVTFDRTDPAVQTQVLVAETG